MAELSVDQGTISEGASVRRWVRRWMREHDLIGHALALHRAGADRSTAEAGMAHKLTDQRGNNNDNYRHNNNGNFDGKLANSSV
ncbi:MAG: hypothetical protein M1826_004484 [Phylliscum demangeonii]|nr:MAG: hypothetical protein M1826_004484 [Phylliscum demangeonii]